MATATTTVLMMTTAPTTMYGCDNRQMATIAGIVAAPAEATEHTPSVSWKRILRVSSARGRRGSRLGGSPLEHASTPPQ
jgi:hypothetical protein